MSKKHKRPCVLNLTQAKKYALHMSRTTRNGKFTRVSKQFLDAIEARTKALIIEAVRSHPSLGKTLK